MASAPWDAYIATKRNTARACNSATAKQWPGKDRMAYPACARTAEDDRPAPRARWLAALAFIILALIVVLMVWSANRSETPGERPAPTTSALTANQCEVSGLH